MRPFRSTAPASPSNTAFHFGLHLAPFLLTLAVTLSAFGSVSAAPGAKEAAAGKPLKATAPTGATEPNLLENGQLSSNGGAWTLEQSSDKARGHLEWLPPQRFPEGGAAVRVSIAAIGTEAWNLQFQQMGLTLREGEPYTLAFWARAVHPRSIGVAANVTEGDGHGIGLNAEHVQLTPDWRRHTLVFTATGTVPAKCRVTFLLGGALGNVELGSVSLRHGVPGKPSGDNLLRNGELRQDGAEWTLERGPEALAQIDWQDDFAPGQPAGKAARIRIEKLGKEAWHVQLLQSGLNLEDNAPYELEFWARADKPRPLSVQTIEDMPDWHQVGLSARIGLTSNWRLYRLAFSAQDAVPEHSRLSFIAGEAEGDVYLRHISLRPLKVVQADPQPHSLIGTWSSRDGAKGTRYTFTFNADGTGSLRTGTAPVQPSQLPSSPVSNPYRWFINGKDVVIAGRRYLWSIETVGSSERLTLKSSSTASYVLFRQPNIH